MTIEKDFSIIVPFYYDVPERGRNLMELLSLIGDKFNIIIINKDVDQFDIEFELRKANIDDKRIKIYNYVNQGPYYNKSRAINEGVKECKTIFAGWHDVDLRIPIGAYHASYEILKSQLKNFVRPFNGLLINILNYKYDQNYDDLNRNPGLVHQILRRDSPGGALFFNVEKFKKIGGMNENFSGWGYEDDEIHWRIKKYNYGIASLSVRGIHIDHPRHSLHSSLHPQFTKNKNEFEKIVSMPLVDFFNYQFSMFTTNSKPDNCGP